MGVKMSEIEFPFEKLSVNLSNEAEKTLFFNNQKYEPIMDFQVSFKPSELKEVEEVVTVQNKVIYPKEFYYLDTLDIKKYDDFNLERMAKNIFEYVSHRFYFDLNFQDEINDWIVKNKRLPTKEEVKEIILKILRKAKEIYLNFSLDLHRNEMVEKAKKELIIKNLKR